MKMNRSCYRVWVSGVLCLVLVGAFSLSSIAAAVASDGIDDAITDSLLVGDLPTGTLTAKGPVLLNGNEVKTGATVTSGNVIQTRTGGHAMIDLASTGQVDLDPITAITLSMSDKSIEATLDKCGQGVTLHLPAGVAGLVKILNISDVGVLNKERQVDVKVFQGEALVKYGQGKEKIVKAGEHKEFDNAVEVTATGNAVYKVYCIEDHYPLLLWAGLAAIAIPAREVIGGGETPPILSSPIP